MLQTQARCGKPGPEFPKGAWGSASAKLGQVQTERPQAVGAVSTRPRGPDPGVGAERGQRGVGTRERMQPAAVRSERSGRVGSGLEGLTREGRWKRSQELGHSLAGADAHRLPVCARREVRAGPVPGGRLLGEGTGHRRRGPAGDDGPGAALDGWS